MSEAQWPQMIAETASKLVKERGGVFVEMTADIPRILIETNNELQNCPPRLLAHINLTLRRSELSSICMHDDPRITIFFCKKKFRSLSNLSFRSTVYRVHVAATAQAIELARRDLQTKVPAFASA